MNENLKRQIDTEYSAEEANKKIAEAADRLRGNPDLLLILETLLFRAEEIRTLLCQPKPSGLPAEDYHLYNANLRGQVYQIEDLIDTFKEQDTDRDAQQQ
jgi:hypothetical protein